MKIKNHLLATLAVLTTYSCMSWANCDPYLQKFAVNSSLMLEVSKDLQLADAAILHSLTISLLDLHHTYSQAVLDAKGPLQVIGVGPVDLVANSDAEPLETAELRDLISSNLKNPKITMRVANYFHPASELSLNYFFEHATNDDIEFLCSELSTPRAAKHKTKAEQVSFIREATKTPDPLANLRASIVVNRSVQKFYRSEFVKFDNYALSAEEFKKLIHLAHGAGTDLNQGIKEGINSHVIQVYIENLDAIRDRMKKVEALLLEGGIDLNVFTNVGLPLEYVLNDLRQSAGIRTDKESKSWKYYYRDQRHLVALFLDDHGIDLGLKNDQDKLIYHVAIEPRMASEDLPEIQSMVKVKLRQYRNP